MAKHIEPNVPSIIALDIHKEPEYNEPEQIRIVSLFSARLIYTGRVSGKLYTWQNSGEIVLVDAQDVPDLLSKKLGESTCCGGSTKGNVLFGLA